MSPIAYSLYSLSDLENQPDQVFGEAFIHGSQFLCLPLASILPINTTAKSATSPLTEPATERLLRAQSPGGRRLVALHQRLHLLRALVDELQAEEAHLVCEGTLNGVHNLLLRLDAMVWQLRARSLVGEKTHAPKGGLL